MIYRRTEQIEWRKFENESLLLNVQTGTYFRINEVGSFIWETLDGKKTAENLINSMVKQFDVSEETARQDYQNFTAQLLQDKLIFSVG